MGLQWRLSPGDSVGFSFSSLTLPFSTEEAEGKWHLKFSWSIGSAQIQLPQRDSGAGEAAQCVKGLMCAGVRTCWLSGPCKKVGRGSVCLESQCWWDRNRQMPGLPGQEGYLLGEFKTRKRPSLKRQRC